MNKTGHLRLPYAGVLAVVVGVAFFLLMTTVQWRLDWPTKTMTARQEALNDSAEVRQLRETQTKNLNHYRWIDKSRGVLGIPIERAMELLAK